MKTKPAVTLPAMPTQFDLGATGLASLERLIIEDRPDIDPITGRRSNPNNRRGSRAETMLAKYLRCHKLNGPQYMAGLALVTASEGHRAQDPLAALGIHVQGGSDPQAARHDAREQFRRLWAMIPTSCRPVVERVVLHDKAVWAGGRANAAHFERLARGLDAMA